MANFDKLQNFFPRGWTFRVFFGGYWDLIETFGEGMVWFPIFSQMVTIYGDNTLTISIAVPKNFFRLLLAPKFVLP